ncbi:hypothetical protein BKA70DRAFT_1166370 [Coprinopsis sp. MPI-PUGE-AT-0042]|nr:hypothetical protein BKA70DRAFT_1166370 [Coprinopsis sp. MPI-PUGE-AT-0042]
MWGSGMPGAGKTIFASIVINEVELRAKASEHPICVGYIYFRYSDHTMATVRDFLLVLIKQTIERHADCLRICEEVYARHIREKTQPLEVELVQLLNRFSEVMRSTFYFLDALDEAPPGVQIDLLERLSTLNAKIFVTSRPLPILEACLPGTHRFPIHAQDKDLDLHIRKEIARNPVLKIIFNQEGLLLRDQLMKTIKQKCGGMFLHASLQLDALRDCTSVHDVRKTLEDFPPRIEDVYQRTWDRILDQSSTRRLLAKNALIWVLCATRSLTIQELRHAVATCPDTHKFDRSRTIDEATVMGLCCGLVNVEEFTNRVRFVHYTAKDVVKRLISGSSPHPHSLPALVCMALLTERGFQRTSLTNGYVLETTLSAEPFLAYAYEAWLIHARESLDDTSTADQLAVFIQGCSAFPIHRAYEFETLEPLHMAAYFNLPIPLAGSASLCEPNRLTRCRRQTPLIIAVRQSSSSAVAELLRLPGILVNAADQDGYTPLMWALGYRIGLGYTHGLNINEPTMALLLAHPDIDVNACDGSGWSALVRVAERDAVDAATILLAHPNIKPNQVNPYGWTALMIASSHGSKRVVEVLLADPRVKVDQKSEAGKTAFEYARKWGYDDIAELLRTHPAREQLQVRRPWRFPELLFRAIRFSHRN